MNYSNDWYRSHVAWLTLILSYTQTVPLFLLVLFFLVQFYFHPYEDTMANYMESFVLLVLVVLLGLGNTTVLIEVVDDGRYFTLLPLYYFPALVGFVTAVAFIAYQVW